MNVIEDQLVRRIEYGFWAAKPRPWVKGCFFVSRQRKKKLNVKDARSMIF